MAVSVSTVEARRHLPISGVPVMRGSFALRLISGLKIALGLSVVTALTFGIYRFWERSRLRRHLWTCLALDGDPVSYHGTGLEKFQGFLLALIVLGVGLALLQLLFVFGAFSLLSGLNPLFSFLLLQGVVLLLAPLVFFVRYRSRRYMLSRTSWRGIRFWMEPGAIGYAWRGCLFGILSVLSLGLFWPAMVFKLRKYQTDRTRFGTALLYQDGDWRLLYGSAKHLLLGLLFVLAAVPFSTLLGSIMGILLIPIGMLWMFFGFIYFRVDAFRRLTAMTVILPFRGYASPAHIKVELSFLRVLFQIFGGILGMSVGLVLYVGFAGALLGAAFAATTDMVLAGDARSAEALIEVLSQSASMGFVLLAVSVMFGLALYGALFFVFLTKPLIGIAAGSVRVDNGDVLFRVGQVAPADLPDADGFASALDAGGAI